MRRPCRGVEEVTSQDEAVASQDEDVTSQDEADASQDEVVASQDEEVTGRERGEAPGRGWRSRRRARTPFPEPLPQIARRSPPGTWKAQSEMGMRRRGERCVRRGRLCVDEEGRVSRKKEVSEKEGSLEAEE
eukprot:1583060-Rhodomonas_salina.1